MAFFISKGPLPTRRALLPAFDAAVAAREGAPSDGQPTGQPGRPDVPSVSKRIGESCTLPPPLYLKLFNQRYLMCFGSFQQATCQCYSTTWVALLLQVCCCQNGRPYFNQPVRICDYVLRKERAHRREGVGIFGVQGVL